MKTTMTIEIETSDMRNIHKDEACQDKPETEKYEALMHDVFKNVIKNYFVEDKFEEDFFNSEEGNMIEDAEEFSIYGNVVIKVDNEEVKNIKKDEISDDEDEECEDH